VWAVADAARHSQSIYADFGVRHLSVGTGTVLDPSSTAAILRTLRAEVDPFLLLVEPGAGVDPDRYELRIPDVYVDNLPDDDDLPALSYGVHPAFAVFSSLATFRVFRLLDRATAASAPALAATAHVSIRTVRSVMKELRGHGLGPTNPAGLAPGSTKSRRRRIT